jgi:hypothetical protein
MSEQVNLTHDEEDKFFDQCDRLADLIHEVGGPEQLISMLHDQMVLEGDAHCRCQWHAPYYVMLKMKLFYLMNEIELLKDWAIGGENEEWRGCNCKEVYPPGFNSHAD